MRFKIGDKVRFLDEMGGGKITAILDNKMVNLETEVGFEIPVLSSELILDYRAQPTPKKITPTTMGSSSSEERQPTPTPTPTPENNISAINPWGKVKEEEGIYLIFEPHNQQWVLTGEIDVILVNHTSFEILYNLFLETGGLLTGIDYGSVPVSSKIILETISRDDIENWTKGAVQILLHEEQVEKLYLPIHAVINIRGSRFFKEGSYISNTLANGKALISVIALKSTFQPAGSNESELKMSSKATKLQSKTKIEPPFIEKFKTQYREAVVDLHIGEIVNNISGLSSRDMFNLQLEYFQKALNSAITNNYRKVTFIHGVGNGTLKNALIKALKERENLKGQSASISKFGVGALDVIIENELR